MEAHLRSELNGLGLYSSLDQHNRYEFSGHAFSFEDWFQHWAESPQTIERCGQFSFTSTPKEFRERLDLLRCALARRRVLFNRGAFAMLERLRLPTFQNC